MTNEQRYIDYKLNGRLDSRELYGHKVQRTIKDSFKVMYKISDEEYEKMQNTNDKTISLVKKYYNSRKNKEENKFEDIKQFYTWYIKQEACCCYCGVHRDDTNGHVIFDNSKRGRGQILEIERVVTFPIEENIYSPDNCRIACHICNNAKSDFLAVSDFKFIAKGIHSFWENKLEKEFTFPDDIYREYRREKK